MTSLSRLFSHREREKKEEEEEEEEKSHNCSSTHTIYIIFR